MAITQELKVKIDAAINADQSIAQLKELKKLQREVGAGSAEYKKIQSAINDTSDTIKTAKGQSQDWIDTLGGLPGPLGSIGRGLDTFTSSTNKLGLAFKSLGIGLIVAAVGALTSAFSQNDKMMKKLQPIMIAFEKILGGIFRAIEPLIDAFLELAMEALPYITDGVGIFYSALVGLFEFLKQSAKGVGNILKGIFTLDFGAISDGLDQLSQGWDKAVEGFKGSMKRYEEGTKEMTKTEKEQLDQQNKNLESYAEKKKKVIEEINSYVAKGVEARGKTQQEELTDAKTTYDNLLKQAQDYGLDTTQITKSYNEQVAKINKTYSDKQKEEDQKKFNDEMKLLQDGNKLKLDQQKANLEQQKVLYGENSIEARNAQDQIFQIQQQSLQDEKNLLESKKELTQEEKNRLQSIVIEQQNLTTAIQVENQKRTKSDVEAQVKTFEEGKKVRDQKFQDDFKAAEGNIQLQQQLLNDRITKESAIYDQQLQNEKLTAEQRKKIEEDYTNFKRQNAETQIAIEQKKKDAQLKLLNAVGAALMAAADIAGRNTKGGKALAVAASLINTYAAIAGQLAAFSKVPIPAYAIVQAVATGLVGFKSVADILKTPVPEPGSTTTPSNVDATSAASVPKPRGMWKGGMVSGPGSGRSDLIPAMLSNGESVINANSTSMFRPLLSAINTIGGGKRFADGGLAVGTFSQNQALSDLQNTLMMNQPPIRTYVVSTDMTSQQMLDRNIKDRSTL
jgi:hypothetical protein